MPIHNQTASVVNLARVRLGEIDLSREFHSIRSDTLKLLLETLIDLGAPEQNMRVAETSTRNITTLMDSLKAAGERNGAA